jgi:lysophospholipid acyltransferase (LPLAT)-like uncharacterized protein
MDEGSGFRFCWAEVGRRTRSAGSGWSEFLNPERWLPPIGDPAEMETIIENQNSKPRSARRSSGVVVPHAPRWHQRLGAWVVYSALRLLTASLRYHWQDESGLGQGQIRGPAIYCVWHNRLALAMKAYFGHAQRHNQTGGLAAMVSASRDGGFLAAILECYGVQPVRGSTSRRGPQALLELTTWAERGLDLAITPDGPRGPCYVVQEGVMSVAQVTGLPIIPFTCRLGWKVRPNSWDRFQIPLPFSRCEMIIGKPIRVPREISDAQRELLRLELQQILKAGED